MDFNRDDNLNINRITKTNVKIIGFGNKYKSDDGIGIRVIEELEKLECFKDKNIEIIDGGTSGIDLLFLLRDCQKAIIIDAMDAGQKNVGDIVNIKVSDVEEFIKRDYKSFSLHDFNLADILKLARALKINTKNISIIGINPKSIDFGENLSPEIEKKIPDIISMVNKEINRS